MKKNEIDLYKLKDDWPDEFVARIHIEEFTKGMYSRSDFIKLDRQGKGVFPRVCIDGRTIYRVDDVITWMKRREKLKELGVITNRIAEKKKRK